MGDAPGNVRPCGASLGGHQIGDVVDGDDEGMIHIASGFALQRHLHIQCPFLPVAPDVDLLAQFRAVDAAQLAECGVQFRRYFCQRSADQGVLAQQGLGRGIYDGDRARIVDAENGCAHAGQHGFGKPCTLIDIVLGLQDLVALVSQLVDHVVECIAEILQIAFGVLGSDLYVEITRAYLVGSGDQPPDRRYHPVRHADTHPDGRKQDDQTHADIEHRKRKLKRPAIAFETPIFGGVGFHEA